MKKKKKSSQDKQKQEEDMMEKAEELKKFIAQERIQQAYRYMQSQQAAMQGTVPGNGGWGQGNFIGGYPDWQQQYYPGYGQQQAVKLEDVFPPSLPEPGIEVQGRPGSESYRVRLTIDIDQQTISDAKDRQLLIQVALQRAIQKATRKILGSIALERIKMQVNKEEEPGTGAAKA